MKILDNQGKTRDRYTVIFENAVYTMSANAQSPQGVCMYAGDPDNLITEPMEGEVEVDISDVPEQVQQSIENILSFA